MLQKAKVVTLSINLLILYHEKVTLVTVKKEILFCRKADKMKVDRRMLNKDVRMIGTVIRRMYPYLLSKEIKGKCNGNDVDSWGRICNRDSRN